MSVLAAHELGRWYGQVVGLSDLSVEVEPGLTGLIGPNGAGKSTLLKLIAGEIRPSRGSVRVLGLDPFANKELHRRIGFCPQQDALYDDMTGLALVRLLVRLSGFCRREAGERARDALERVGLGEALDRRVGGYSKGMRQRVKLAQSIAHGPELLVLDEPLTGLDPIARRDVIRLLRELGEGGMSVLLSSHVLHEVQSVTDSILLLHRGRLLAQGTVGEVRELLSQHPRRVEIDARRARDLAQALIGNPDVLSVALERAEDEGAGDRLIARVKSAAEFFPFLTTTAATGGFGITSLESPDDDLESVFDYLVP